MSRLRLLTIASYPAYSFCLRAAATYLSLGARFARPTLHFGFTTMPGQSPRILLIEGDRTLLEITAFRLELLGYEVITLDTAERALEWLHEQLPTLVIVDHVLPGIDGIEFINRLSNDTRTSNIPIMFLSTNGDLEDVQKAYNAGADEYLVIPYDPIVLEAKVERLASAMTQTA
jgi:DNA-binding response OmpR family regulator